MFLNQSAQPPHATQYTLIPPMKSSPKSHKEFCNSSLVTVATAIDVANGVSNDFSKLKERFKKLDDDTVTDRDILFEEQNKMIKELFSKAEKVFDSNVKLAEITTNCVQKQLESREMMLEEVAKMKKVEEEPSIDVFAEECPKPEKVKSDSSTCAVTTPVERATNLVKKLKNFELELMLFKAKIDVYKKDHDTNYLNELDRLKKDFNEIIVNGFKKLGETARQYEKELNTTLSDLEKFSEPESEIDEVYLFFKQSLTEKWSRIKNRLSSEFVYQINHRIGKFLNQPGGKRSMETLDIFKLSIKSATGYETLENPSVTDPFAEIKQDKAAEESQA